MVSSDSDSMFIHTYSAFGLRESYVGRFFFLDLQREGVLDLILKIICMKNSKI